MARHRAALRRELAQRIFEAAARTIKERIKQGESYDSIVSGDPEIVEFLDLRLSFISGEVIEYSFTMDKTKAVIGQAQIRRYQGDNIRRAVYSCDKRNPKESVLFTTNVIRPDVEFTKTKSI